MRLTKDTIIGDLLDWDASCAQVLEENGMDCFGCPAARGETLEQACAVHRLDQAVLLEHLRAHIAQSGRTY